MNTVSDATFDSVVIDSDKVVLVDFWAPWCGPCLAIAPLLEEVSTTHGDGFTVVKLNVDENPDTAVRFGVRSIPTMIMFKQGQAVDTKIGAGQSRVQLSKWIDSHL